MKTLYCEFAHFANLVEVAPSHSALWDMCRWSMAVNTSRELNIETKDLLIHQWLLTLIKRASI